MGEAKQKKSATAKLIEQFPDCSLCGGLRPSTTRDHIPPKALFDNSLRPDKLVMPACGICNQGTSTADLVAAIISRWRFDDSDSRGLIDHARLVARLRRQAPDVVAEWTKLGFEESRRGRRHLEKHGVNVPANAGIVAIGKVSIRYINLFAYKIALALYFEHFRSPLPNTGLVSAIWRTKEDFAKLGVPRELIEMMPGYATLQQGQWNVQKDFEYRFATNNEDGIFGCLARFRNGLFVTGFALRNGEMLSESNRTRDWIRPSDLLAILKLPEFAKRMH